MSATPRLCIAYQGEPGAYSEDAIQLLFEAPADQLPCTNHEDAINALLDGRADRVILAVENTLVGTVTDTQAAIDRSPQLSAVGEVVVAVHHCLLAPPGATVDSIATVLSHSLAIAQCQHFLRAHPRIQTHGLFDTAGAAREVAQLGDPSFAAIAGRSAASRYALDVIAADIEDRHDNQTRFLVFAREPDMPPAGTPARTMIAFTTQDVPGALLTALLPFARHGVNLRRIDTRPTGEPWSYRFFVEFDHDVGDPRVTAALQDVATATAAVRIVGTFARWQAGRRGSIGWTPTDEALT